MGFLSSIAPVFGNSIVGNLLKSKAADKANDAEANQYAAQVQRSEKWNQKGYDLANAQFRTNIQTRVKDARKAGIHPLFALGATGAGGSFSAGGEAPLPAGQHVTGSGIGTGLEVLANNKEASALEQAQTRAANAQALRNETDAMRIASEIKRAEQAAIHGTGTPQPDTPTYDPTTGVTVYPLGERKPGPTPLVVNPNSSIPRRVTVRGPGGHTKALNPDIGVDEVGQLDWLYQPLFQAIDLIRGTNRMGPNRFSGDPDIYSRWAKVKRKMAKRRSANQWAWKKQGRYQ